MSSVDSRVIALPAAMRDEIVAHSNQEWPRECCGVILGHGESFTELRRMVNVYPGEDFYEIESSALYRLYLETEERGLEISAIYHSHPVSVAYPSARDVEHAGWPDAVYLICSLEQKDAPSLRAFTIVDANVTELTIS